MFGDFSFEEIKNFISSFFDTFGMLIGFLAFIPYQVWIILSFAVCGFVIVGIIRALL